MTNSNCYTKIHFSWIGMQIINIIIKCIVYMFALSFLQRLLHFNDEIKYVLLIVIIILLMIHVLLYWKNFHLFFDQTRLTIKEGGFFKKERLVNFKDIEGFNEKSNVLEKMFHLSSLILKVEASSSEKKIIIPFVKNKDINKIKDYISISEEKTNINNVDNYLYKMSYQKILKGSFASLNIIILFTFIYTIYINISDFLNISNYVQLLQNLYFKSLTTIIVGSITFIILSLIFGITKNFILYGNFKLNNQNGQIDTQWGYLSTYHNVVEKDGISAINLKASFWQNLFKVNQVSVININSNNKDIETNIIFPFLETSNINYYLNILFQINLYNKKFIRLKGRALIIKLLRTSWSWLIILPICLYFFGEFSFVIYLLMFFIVLSQALQTIFNKYYYSSNLLVYRNSGVSLNQYIVKMQDIEDLILTQSFLQQKLNLCSIEIVIKDQPPKKIKLHDIYYLHAYRIIKYFKKMQYVE